jgi:hypothetical protein
MWWVKFILLIAITVGVTWLIVWVDTTYGRHIKTDPGAATDRGIFRGITYFLLNLADLFK